MDVFLFYYPVVDFVLLPVLSSLHGGYILLLCYALCA